MGKRPWGEVRGLSEQIDFKLLPKLLIVNAQEGNVAFVSDGDNCGRILGVRVALLDFDAGVVLDAVGVGEDLATANDEGGRRGGALRSHGPGKLIVGLTMGAENLQDGVEDMLVRLGGVVVLDEGVRHWGRALQARRRLRVEGVAGRSRVAGRGTERNGAVQCRLAEDGRRRQKAQRHVGGGGV